MIYLASPYSHPSEDIRRERYEETLQATAHLLFAKNLRVFSPVVYAHEMAVKYELAYDAASWNNFNVAMLRHAEQVFVLCLDDWQDSKGIQAELRLAKELVLPITYIDLFGESIL